MLTRSIVVAMLGCVVASAAVGQTRYRMEPLGLLPSGKLSGQATAINDSGQVTGTSDNKTFIWQDGAMQYLPLPQGAISSVGRDINNLGEICGQDTFRTGSPPFYLTSYEAFTWDETSGRETISGFTKADRINDSGTMIVGGQLVIGGSGSLLFSDGAQAALAPLEGDTGATPRAINNSDVAAGGSSIQVSETGPGGLIMFVTYHTATIWTDPDTPVALGYLDPSDDSSIVTGLNDSGVAVGTSEGDATGKRGFIWTDAMTGMEDLGDLGADFVSPAAISDNNLVVGSAQLAELPGGESGPVHAFVWQDGAMQDINDLIPSATDTELTGAVDVNASGQILCRGTVDGSLDAFVLTPYVLGDFDRNGVLNGLDIPGFKDALADPALWSATNDISADLLGDFDGNGSFNGLDIPGFKDGLAGTSVPEPATMVLLAAGAIAVWRRKG